LVRRDRNRIEAALAFLGFYLYGVHWYTSKRAFLDLGLFRDRNFLASNVFIFVLGVCCRDDGAAAAVPAEPHELSGRDDRDAASPREARHADCDDAGWPPARAPDARILTAMA
jgi:hypothetical protein